MRKSKLCILTCCVGVSWATFVIAQPAASGNDDQEKALQALRQAEATPLEQPAATPQKAARKKKKAAKETTPAVVQPAAAVPVGAGISDDQSKALEALRQAEAQPIVPDQAPAPAAPAVSSVPAAPTALAAPAVPAAPAVTVAPIAPTVTSAPITPTVTATPAAPISEAQQEDQTKALQALRQAEEQPAPPAQMTPAQAKKEAAARKKAQDEAARRVQRVERLQSEMKNAPAPTQTVSNPPSVNTNALSSKEQKLADLLRRYQADEITPYEYHLERAKIVAEP
jgi:hypothetical protein